MGFFKNLFKKKKGGTLLGNLVRGVANKASGGILGNGVQLAKNDAKIEQREYNQAVQVEAQRQLAKNPAFQAGQTATSKITIPGVPSIPSESKMDLKAYAKKYWGYAVGALAVIGGIVYVTKSKKRFF